MSTDSYHEDMHRKHLPRTVHSSQALAIDAVTPIAMSPQALAEAVAADGFDAHIGAVADLVDETRRLGISDVLAAVVLDRHQPLVARERAFGRLVAAYCRSLERQSATEPPPTSDRFTVAA